jgi:hypothetical protein
MRDPRREKSGIVPAASKRPTTDFYQYDSDLSPKSVARTWIALEIRVASDYTGVFVAAVRGIVEHGGIFPDLGRSVGLKIDY